MKTYTIVYMEFFGYDVSDFIPCEVCGQKSVDIAHIYPKGKYPELMNDIFNLAAVTRQNHINYENKKEELLEMHIRTMLHYQQKKTIALLNELTTKHTLFNQIHEALIKINEPNRI